MGEGWREGSRDAFRFSHRKIPPLNADIMATRWNRGALLFCVRPYKKGKRQNGRNIGKKTRARLGAPRVTEGLKMRASTLTYRNTNLRTALMAVSLLRQRHLAGRAILSSAGYSTRGGFPISDIPACMSRIRVCRCVCRCVYTPVWW